MDSTLQAKCPVKICAASNYTITFTEITSQNKIQKLFSLAKEYLSRVSFRSLKNAWQIGSKNDLSQSLLYGWQPGSFVTPFRIPKGTVYLTANTAVMRVIFQNLRKSEDGLFFDHENKKVFIKGILNDIYPEEVKHFGIDKISEMLVLTASADHLKSIRAPMVSVLGLSSVKEYTVKLNTIADDIFESLSAAEKNDCNIEELAFEFAVTVISKFITGYNTTRENYRLLAKALNSFSKRLSRIISYRPATPIEEQELKEGLIMLKDIINQNMTSDDPSPFVFKLKELGWEDFKIRANLLFMYFAASETTASSINYMLGQLGRSENKHYLTELKHPEKGENFLSKVVAETLRLHPPAFVEGRQFRRDTLLEVQDEEGRVLKKMKFLQGHSILCLTQVAALDPLLYPNPHCFNPLRFENVSSQLPWYPFGAGNHVCPGQYLAHAELRVFLSRLISKFNIRTLNSEERVQQHGFFTLRATATHLQLTEQC